MIRLRAKLDAKGVLKSFRRMPREVKKVTSQEVNRQMRTSIGGTGNSRALPVVGMVRRMSKAWNVRPQRRIRKRIFVPRGAFSRPTTLTATGLTLFDTLPMRYFPKGLPAGAKALPSGVDKVGREPFGGEFPVKLRSGATGVMRKLRPQVWSRKSNPGPSTNYVPIGWSKYVDVFAPAKSIRASVLNDLAKHWPAQMSAALRKVLPRVMRGRRA